MKNRSDIILVMILLMQCLHVSVGGAAGPSAEPSFHPYITAQEEYNDNINLTPANKRANYITTVGSGLTYQKSEKMSGIDVDYHLGFVNYSSDRDKNHIRQKGSVNVRYLTKEHIHFYLKGALIQTDELREPEPLTTPAENKYLLATAPERASYWRNVVEPVIEYQFGPENRTGLAYRNNIFRTSRIGGQDSQENYIRPFFDYWYDKRNGIHLEYGYTIGKFDQSADMNAQKANVRYTHRLGPQSTVFGEYTVMKRTFGTSSISYDIHEPSVGITHAFNPALIGAAKIGYFEKTPASGSAVDGLSYQASITNRAARTTYIVNLQGGYTEDLFTSENLGFKLYHRLTGSLTHLPGKRTSIGFSGSVERAEFDEGRADWLGGVTGRVTHRPLQWLSVGLECSHRVRSSSSDRYDYRENRGMVKITATY